MSKILLIEDDITLAKGLSEYLSLEDFTVYAAGTKKEGLEAIGSESFELALIDISLPDGNGFSIAEAAKEASLPFIFLTASGDEYTTVAGLELGALDYIAKPFRPRELLSRIKNAIRLSGARGGVVQLSDKVKVDTKRGIAIKEGEELFLSALEYKLLLIFINNRGSVLTRAKLLECIWDAAGEFVNDNTLSVYIKRLRDKIEDDPQNPKIIKTVRGLGYRLEVQ